MDVSELLTAQTLVGQYNQLSAAINLFYQAGTIISSVTFTGADQGMTMGTPVDTRTYSFPPEVLNGLENMLWTQLQSVADQLTALGVTGLVQPRQGKRA